MQSDLLEDSTRKTLGVGVAAVVLFITFGSLVAAGMPFLTALVGVGVGLAGVTTASGVVPMSSTAPILALMLGLAATTPCSSSPGTGDR